MLKIKLILLVVISVFATAAAATSANTIVKKADAVRNPAQSFFMKVNVETKGEATKVFEVFTGGKNKTLIKTTSPKRDVGRNLLMIDENMWAYIPNLKRDIRVSLNQKLTGQAANGDISRMKWSGDYNAKIEKQTSQHWQLFLTAKKKDLTYSKIRAWISKKGYRPIRAEYLTSTGIVLKTATFSKYKRIAGATRPTVVKIVDAKQKSKSSNIVIVEMKKRTFSSSTFSRENLK